VPAGPAGGKRPGRPKPRPASPLSEDSDVVEVCTPDSSFEAWADGMGATGEDPKPAPTSMSLDTETFGPSQPAPDYDAAAANVFGDSAQPPAASERLPSCLTARGVAAEDALGALRALCLPPFVGDDRPGGGFMAPTVPPVGGSARPSFIFCTSS
jgi:hypothetical protein